MRSAEPAPSGFKWVDHWDGPQLVPVTPHPEFTVVGTMSGDFSELIGGNITQDDVDDLIAWAIHDELMKDE